MSRLKLWLAVLVILQTIDAAGQELELPMQFSSTGRSCSGSLTIQRETISWVTPFSQCNASPYELMERSDDGVGLRQTFLLQNSSPACHYRVISLTHSNKQKDELGWEIIGYASTEQFYSDKKSGYASDDASIMSCYLVRPTQERTDRTLRH